MTKLPTSDNQNATCLMVSGRLGLGIVTYTPTLWQTKSFGA